MKPTNVFQAALVKLLKEVFDGPPAQEAYVLNPGDAGMLRQLATIAPERASERPMPGETTIAAHVDHVLYGLTLLNRWADGEPNPWADADWNASWQRKIVSADEWTSLRHRLEEAAARWQDAVQQRDDWEEMSAAGSLASAAHVAYHLGAIRQLIAATEKA
jgi:hypothetical protein